MYEDSSMEFDMFEQARRHLVEALIHDGRTSVDAERISLYVIQGVRGIPRLLASLADAKPNNHKATIDALNGVLENSLALDKVREMLLIDDEKPIH